ncbi:arginase family protein [Actinokineospora sp. HUAS TT18]|uniref:arginase family protein n=1 Tax=Actinokineospora sp. HUAS TT18 TaxID=3447451 RepID=UPI003F52255C
MKIAVLDAPTNLGLRPPVPGAVPGCYKAPGALRDLDLLRRLDARDAGHLVAPRYDRGDWKPGDGVFHAPQIAAYARALADRLRDIPELPLVLGGDCSLLLGPALHAAADPRRIGLVYLDGSADLRHPGNSTVVGAAGGEALALVTGRGQADLTTGEPLFADEDVVVLGIRDYDEEIPDLTAAGIAFRHTPAIRAAGAPASAAWVRSTLAHVDAYWVHLDVDVLDPTVLHAVDAPDPGGLTALELVELVRPLVTAPECIGMDLTIFDPDLDPDGRQARLVADLVVDLLA